MCVCALIYPREAGGEYKEISVDIRDLLDRGISSISSAQEPKSAKS